MKNNKQSDQPKKWLAGKWGNVLIVVCAVILVVCIVRVSFAIAEYRKNDQLHNDLQNDVQNAIDNKTTTERTSAVVPGTDDQPGTQTDVVEPPRQVKEEYSAMYEKMTELKASYPDLFGWIYVEFDKDSQISLPVMKSTDNNYYISHAYNGEESRAGAIFADYRNTDKRLTANQNIVLYGHNMNNSSMFAKISTMYKKEQIFNNVPVILYTVEGMYTFEVFSVYNSKAGEDYDTIGFPGDELEAFCKAKAIKSYLAKEMDFTDVETIITLVTCTNYASTGRVIVHGVLTANDSYFLD